MGKSKKLSDKERRDCDESSEFEPSRKKVKHDVSEETNFAECEVWLVKRPSKIPLECLADCDLSEADQCEFNFGEESFECDKLELNLGSVALFQVSGTDQQYHKVSKQPRGAFVISKVPQKSDAVLPLGDDTNIPSVEDYTDLRQRYVPFGCSIKEKVKKRKKTKKEKHHSKEKDAHS